MKYHIRLEDKKSGKIEDLYNNVFDPQNGVAFFEIDKNWKLIFARPFVCSKRGMDLYEGDRVLVKGTKRHGQYETTIIRDTQGWTLEENKTYFYNDKCLIAVIEKL